MAPAVVESDIAPAVASLAQQGIRALVVRSDVLFNGRPKQLVPLSAQYALPAIYPLREFAVAGGLMSYGASLREALHQVGLYTGRILKGEKPATCRFSSRPKSSWWSILKPLRRSASTSRLRCSPAPTRS